MCFALKASLGLLFFVYILISSFAFFLSSLWKKIYHGNNVISRWRHQWHSDIICLASVVLDNAVFIQLKQHGDWQKPIDQYYGKFPHEHNPSSHFRYIQCILPDAACCVVSRVVWIPWEYHKDSLNWNLASNPHVHQCTTRARVLGNNGCSKSGREPSATLPKSHREGNGIVGLTPATWPYSFGGTMYIISLSIYIVHYFCLCKLLSVFQYDEVNCVHCCAYAISWEQIPPGMLNYTNQTWTGVDLLIRKGKWTRNLYIYLYLLCIPWNSLDLNENRLAFCYNLFSKT